MAFSSLPTCYWGRNPKERNKYQVRRRWREGQSIRLYAFVTNDIHKPAERGGSTVQSTAERALPCPVITNKQQPAARQNRNIEKPECPGVGSHVLHTFGEKHALAVKTATHTQSPFARLIYLSTSGYRWADRALFVAFRETMLCLGVIVYIHVGISEKKQRTLYMRASPG